jgi:hypothetical protein
MTQSSPVVALAAGIVGVVFILFGLTLNLGDGWWHGFWTGIMTMLTPSLGLLACLLRRQTVDEG